MHTKTVVFVNSFINPKGVYIKINDSNGQELNENDIVNLTANNFTDKSEHFDICIFHVSKNELNQLTENIVKLFQARFPQKINIILDDIDKFTKSDLVEYRQQLLMLADYMFNNHFGENICINIFDNLNSKRNNCGCGIDTFTVAPNGKLYFCPGLYFYNEDLNIGDLRDGFNINLDSSHRQTKEFRCIYLNKKMTGEYEIEPNILLDLEDIEIEVRTKLKNMLSNKKFNEELEVMNI